MENININFAYDGFLYAPLFLAEELGVFQKRMVSRYCKGDEPAIEKLAVPVDPENPGRNWFAICDPFAKDITAVQKVLGRKDDVCIVASFIHRLPVWLYYDSDFGGCGAEADLLNRRADVDHLRCYTHNNTGYLVGERLRRRLDLSPDKLAECPFGAEFGTTLDPLLPKTVVVTSDVLRLIKNGDFDNGHAFFSYAQHVPELNPFLFTAVFTLKSVIDQHLDAVLSLLSGLRLAAHQMTEPSSIPVLANHYTGFSEPNIAKAVSALDEEQIYSTDFDLDEAATAYENARIAWQGIRPKVAFAEIEKVREPIPCLLLKNGWHTDRVLVNLFVQRWKTDANLVAILSKELPQRPVNPMNNAYHLLFAVSLLAVNVGAGVLLVHGWTKKTADDVGYWWLSAIMAAIQMVLSGVLAWNVVKRFELKGFEFLASMIVCLFFGVLAIVTWLVK